MKIEDAATPHLTFTEQGSDPATPAAGTWLEFFKAGGLYVIDDAGVVTGPFGSAADLAAHIADTTAAHAASAISADSTTLVGTGTDVQAVLEELDNGIADHLADATAAHAATAIAFTPAGTIAATTVQAAIEEVATEAGGGGSVSDTAYAGSWDGVTTIAPSKNAVYGKIETLLPQAGHVIKYKAADESVTSSTTLQDDDDLFLAIAASEVWKIRWIIYATGAEAGDIKFALTVPTSCAVTWAGVGLGNATSGTDTATMRDRGETVSGNALGWGFGSASSANPNVFIVEAFVVNSTNAGNVKLQWTQNASSGTATTVLTRSHMVAERVPF